MRDEAYAAPADDGQKLATISRGVGRELRIRAREYLGHRYIDIREWSQSKDGETWWPTKGKGVTVKLRELADVIGALEAARQLS